MDYFDESDAIPMKRRQMQNLSKVWSPAWADVLANSVNSEGDEYDSLGRNITAQKRRQELYPWYTVDRQKLIGKGSYPTSL